jgi:UDP-N-acetylglucosamine 2-epimerase (non-hydrolysing)
MLKKVVFIIGTRPECIKLAPLIIEFRKSNLFHVEICSTGQHSYMLTQAFEMFNIFPDAELSLMTPNQSLSLFLSRAIKSLDLFFQKSNPDFVFIQGDTSSVLAASIAAFYRKIKVFHVEAGLRTFLKYSPFPEEMHRILASRICDLHFSPTIAAKQNLLNEGINENLIYVTGNTSIDALLLAVSKIREDKAKSFFPEKLPRGFSNEKRVILLTMHRRENLDLGFKNVCCAINYLSKKYDDYVFVFPVHLNPYVQKMAKTYLSGIHNVYLIEPLNYFQFVFLLDCSFIILTDSGGIQEEAPTLNKPVLVLRESTERMEGIEAGCAKLVGTNKDLIITEFERLVTDSNYYNSMSTVENPYGNGTSSKKIFEVVCNFIFCNG